MTAHRTPLLPAMLALIEQRGGVMHTSELRKELPMSAAAIYNACRSALDEGYLTERRVKCASGVGRKQSEYVRTSKAYEQIGILRVDREPVEQQDAAAHPYRHWQDVLMFGAYPKPFEPHAQRGRVYRAMDDDDREVA